MCPTYVFKDNETGELVEKIMSYTKLEQFKQDNPNLVQYFSADTIPVLSDGTRMNTPGTGRPDSTFEKYVINRIKETVPGNTVKAGHKTQQPREW